MINFNSKNEGTWFYFDESDHDAGSLCLRELSTRELEKINLLTEKTSKKVMHGVVYDDVKIDVKRASRMRWQYCIVDWKGILVDAPVDENGIMLPGATEAECNDINKEKLMGSNDFIKFMVDCIEELTETNKALEGARVKNLPSSVDGDSEPEEKSAETNA